MKFFTFIMAFLILALSIMPCADGAAAMSKVKTELKKSDQHNHTSQDTCSPLCICACCGINTINHFNSISILIASVKSISQNTFLPSEVIDITLPIWQPPKLV